LISTKPGFIHTQEVSCFCGFPCGCFSPKAFDFRDVDSKLKDADPRLEVGNWVLVEYDSELFPGTITQ
ncbi:hypothetical protein KUCAC02_006312%2C partial, partial [Scomber scombrus]